GGPQGSGCCIRLLALAWHGFCPSSALTAGRVLQHDPGGHLPDCHSQQAAVLEGSWQTCWRDSQGPVGRAGHLRHCVRTSWRYFCPSPDG
ncbi:unnamed protein product, partial [Polarella glacialis]